MPPQFSVRSSWYYCLVDLAGLPALGRLRDQGVILCYHNVVPDDWNGPGDPGLHLRSSRFERQVHWLTERYACVSLEEFAGRLERGASLKRVAAITFDDAYEGVFDLALPLLRSLGVPATVFVVASAAERPEEFWWDGVEPGGPTRHAYRLRELQGDGALIRATEQHAVATLSAPLPRPADWQTIRRGLGSGVSLGAHSLTHRALPRLPDRELLDEVDRSRELIAEFADVVPETFSYPYGLWDGRVRAAVRSAGYRAAVTMDFGLNGRGADPWSLRRVNVPAGIADDAFGAWVSGFSPHALRPRGMPCMDP